MDELTKKGLNYINDCENRLRIFARQKIAEGCEEDGWFGFDCVRICAEDFDSDIENCVDVNVWRDEHGKWRAGAYPMEVNVRGEIQTNGQDFVNLF